MHFTNTYAQTQQINRNRSTILNKINTDWLGLVMDLKAGILKKNKQKQSFF